MAKGQNLKKDIQSKILETFPGSFLYNDGKEIRISGIEDGQEVQIKVTLTAAKENVTQGEDFIIPGEKAPDMPITPPQKPSINIEYSEKEKETISAYLRALGL